MKLSAKRALSILFAAVFLLASLMLYALLIRPEYEVVRQLRGELASKSNFLEEQKNSITNVQNLIVQYQAAAKAGEALSLALPSKEDVSSVMAQINAISQVSGVTIENAVLSYLPIQSSAAQVSSAGRIGSLRIDLRLLGPYASFKRFLQSLETNIRIMDLKSLQIEPVGSRDKPDLFFYNLSVDTYYQTK